MPHHLLDVLDVTETASVAAYQRDARAVRRASCWPRAGCRCWSAAPACTSAPCSTTWSSPAPTRRSARRLEAELAARRRRRAARPAGRASTRRPPTAILPSNGRRIVRALEVIELTGRPFSATHARAGPGPLRRRADRPRPGRPTSSTRRVDAAGDRMFAAGPGRRGPRARAAGPARRAGRRRRALGYQQVARRARRRRVTWTQAAARRPRGPPAGSSAASGPGSAATRAITWLDADAAPTCVERRRAALRLDGVTASPFVKGHGTENDFVLLPDLDAALDLTAALVARALRPARRARRRRGAAGRARPRRSRTGRPMLDDDVVHGLPQRRRLGRRDVRQRRAGVRPLPGRRRAGRRGREFPVGTRGGRAAGRGRRGRRGRRRHGPGPRHAASPARPSAARTLAGRRRGRRQPAPGLRRSTGSTTWTCTDAARLRPGGVPATA